MKKFTLFLLVMIMATVTFAQAPQKLNKRSLDAQKPASVHMSDMQKKNVVGKVDGRRVILNAPAKASRPLKAQKNGMKVSKQLASPSKVQLRNDFAVKVPKNIAQLKAAKQSGKKVQKAPRKAASTTPVTAPAGLETDDYKAGGFSYSDMGQVEYDVKVGVDGNDVYVQGLFRGIPDAWVKGVKSGNKVTFANEQYLGETLVTNTVTGEDELLPIYMSYTADMQECTDLVLTIGDEGVMDDLEGGLLLFTVNGVEGAVDALGYLNLTPASLFENVDKTLVTLPAGVEQWGVDITATRYSDGKQVANTGIMAKDGNDLYVLGICPDISGWVKGTIGADNVVTFPKGQYIGNLSGYDIWFMGVNPYSGTLGDVTATWDPAERTLEFGKDFWIVENADARKLLYLDVFSETFVAPMSSDRQVVIPPANLVTKSYNAKVSSLGNYSYAKDTYKVNIGFDGDEAYMQGLLYFAPSAWIKGTRNADGSLTFGKNQYLGTVQGYDTYVVPCSDETEEVPAEIYDSFTFKYDAENDVYTCNEKNTFISFSVEPECTDAIEIIHNVVLNSEGSTGGDDEISTDVIYAQPEGELKTYTRSGGAYYSFWGYLVNTTQGGTSIKIVRNGNDIYMENPISQAMVEGGTWVKGTVEGNKIHMPLKQCVVFFEDEGYGYYTAAFRPEMVYDEWNDEEVMTYVMADDKEITFTIDDAAGTITLDKVSNFDEETNIADWIYGLAYTDNHEWAQLGDYNSVYNVFNDEYATIPESLTAEPWAMMYEDENNYSSARIVNVAIDGNKMFVAGMAEDDPEAAMVGTISDGKVTFASDQYVGLSSGFIAYGVFAKTSVELKYDPYYDEEYEETSFEYLPEYSFTYDAAEKTMKSAKDVAFVVNAGKGADEVLWITQANNPRFNYFEEVPATPSDPEFLGFSDWFDDYGYNMLSCNVKLEDVNGKYMNQDKVFYTLWVKIDDEVEQFVFDSQDYVGFEELGITEMTEVPVNFTVLDGEGYEDISASASGICLYQSGFDDYGIQTIYYGGDERRTSNIVWESGETDGIKDIHVNKPGSSSIYDLQGRKLQKLQKGVNIINMNGKTAKVVVK